MHKFGLVLAILCTYSCSPKGELTRTLHVPHQRYLDRQNPAAAKKAEPRAALNPGLPGSCQIVATTTLCISCEDEASQVYRCYDYKSAFTPETDCYHNNDFVKCLVKKPPFALYLEHKNSSEKLFQENLTIWIDAVHRIWGEKLTETEKQESQRTFAALKIISAILSSQTTLDELDQQKLVDSLELKSPEHKTLAMAYLTRLQENRQAGKLKLTDTLQGFSELLKKTHGPSLLFEKFNTMSLEGLEVE